MIMVDIALWLLAAAVSVLWLGRTWSHGMFRAKTRANPITSGVDVVVALAVLSRSRRAARPDSG
jgi:hypothetical protein